MIMILDRSPHYVESFAFDQNFSQADEFSSNLVRKPINSGNDLFVITGLDWVLAASHVVRDEEGIQPYWGQPQTIISLAASLEREYGKIIPEDDRDVQTDPEL